MAKGVNVRRLYSHSVQLRNEQRFEEAVVVLEQILEARPDHLPSRQRISDLYVQLGRTEQAIDSLFRLCELHRQIGGYQEYKALNAIRRIIRLDPTCTRALLQLGELADYENHPREIMDSYEAAAELLAEKGVSLEDNEAVKRLLALQPNHVLIKRLQGAAPVGPVAVNPDFETRLTSDPDDDSLYRVYGDWLQARGDPRGELIALQCVLQDLGANGYREPDPDDERDDDERADELDARDDSETSDNTVRDATRRAAREAACLRAHERVRDHLARHQTYLTWELDSFLDFEWRSGFIRRVGIRGGMWSLSSDSQDDVICHLLRLPTAGLVRDIYLRQPRHLAILMESASGRVFPTVRELNIDNGYMAWRAGSHAGWPRFHSGEDADATGLCERFPDLERLAIYASGLEVDRLYFPRLRDASLVTLGPNDDLVHAVCHAHWPELQRLVLCCTGLGPEQRAAILDSESLGSVMHLSFILDGRCTELINAPLLPRLRTLRLYGWLGNPGARQLLARIDRFAHLERLEIDCALINDAQSILDELTADPRIEGLER